MKRTRKPEGETKPDGDADKATYEVGYCRPPKHTRFRAGCSGNPQGRPARHCNLRTVVRQAFKEKVTVNEGGRQRKVTRLDAVVRVALNNALKGDLRATQNVIQLARSVGLMDEEKEAIVTEAVSAADQVIIDDFLARNGQQTGPDASLSGLDSLEKEPSNDATLEGSNDG